MKLKRLSTVILIALICVLSIHVLFQLTRRWRADLTQDDMYSLTQGTRQILAKMTDEGAEPIDMRLYFSLTAGKSLPKFIKQFIVYEEYLRALLGEYERAAGGKIRVQLIDPVPDSDAAQDALDYGLDGKQINQHGDLFFFGLVLETQTGSRDRIEFLWPNNQEDVEYEISKRLYSLLWPNQKRIGVLAGLEVLANDDPYMAQLLAAQGKRAPESWISMRVLQEQYQVTSIDPDTDHISKDDYDLLIIVHPRAFGDKTLWAIDEWVTTGGNALVFCDPYSIDDRPPQNPQQPWAAYQYQPSSNLARLTEAWGVTRVENEVAADLGLGMRRQTSRRGPAEKVIVDLLFTEQNAVGAISDDHPITRGLGNLRLFMAGKLEISEPLDPGITVTPLISTTAGGNTLTMKPGFPGDGNQLVFMDANSPAKLVDAFTEGDEPVMLACLISGMLKPAFPDGATFPDKVQEPPPGMPPGIQMPPADDSEMITTDPVPAERRAEATVLLLSDADVISDQIAYQQSLFGPMAANDNHKLLLNAVDFLLGAKELMDVRAKSSIERPFILFDQIEEEAEARTREREKELRAEVQRFQEEVQSKQRDLSQRNAALFQKKLQDEVDALNDRIKDGNRELREIRSQRRAALESEEAWIRFSIMWLMPIVVFALGITVLARRRIKQRKAQEAQR